MRRPGMVNALGALAWGLVMLPALTVDHTAAAAVIFLAGGMVWGPYTAVEVTVLQRWIDPARHGRVFGIQRSLLGTATPAGAALGAIFLPHTSAAILLAASALACATAGALALLNSDLRRSM